MVDNLDQHSVLTLHPEITPHELLGYKVYTPLINSYDGLLRGANMIGFVGEELIYFYLRGKYPEYEGFLVEWSNQTFDEGLPYDIVVSRQISPNDVEIIEYCEVKSTKKKSSASFRLSRNEWKKALGCRALFVVYRVLGVKEVPTDEDTAVEIVRVVDPATLVEERLLKRTVKQKK